MCTTENVDSPPRFRPWRWRRPRCRISSSLSPFSPGPAARTLTFDSMLQQQQKKGISTSPRSER
jgi:hypothetical protein